MVVLCISIRLYYTSRIIIGGDEEKHTYCPNINNTWNVHGGGGSATTLNFLSQNQNGRLIHSHYILMNRLIGCIILSRLTGVSVFRIMPLYSVGFGLHFLL